MIKINLINGEFNKQDTLDLITQMINVKIKFHENKIINNNNEEDIKYRESKIKILQSELRKLKNDVDTNIASCSIISIIEIDNKINK
ncbi:MAG TPA: hypothetical protein PK323_13180 [Bacteroidia bacterium]|nr:hypothetical protein [Bacteroidia bacterium]